MAELARNLPNKAIIVPALFGPIFWRKLFFGINKPNRINFMFISFFCEFQFKKKTKKIFYFFSAKKSNFWNKFFHSINQLLCYVIYELKFKNFFSVLDENLK